MYQPVWGKYRQHVCVSRVREARRTGNQEDTTREETGFEETEEETAGEELSPVGDETHTEHDSTPEDGDGGEEDSGTNFADEQVGRQFENDVGNLMSTDPSSVSVSFSLVTAVQPGGSSQLTKKTRVMME